MTTWPAAADLGDLPTLTANIRPFRSEKTVDELVAETHAVLADLTRAVTASRRARGADTELGRAA